MEKISNFFLETLSSIIVGAALAPLFKFLGDIAILSKILS